MLKWKVAINTNRYAEDQLASVFRVHAYYFSYTVQMYHEMQIFQVEKIVSFLSEKNGKQGQVHEVIPTILQLDAVIVSSISHYVFFCLSNFHHLSSD